jgi:hypothetical protein
MNQLHRFKTKKGLEILMRQYWKNRGNYMPPEGDDEDEDNDGVYVKDIRDFINDNVAPLDLDYSETEDGDWWAVRFYITLQIGVDQVSAWIHLHSDDGDQMGNFPYVVNTLWSWIQEAKQKIKITKRLIKPNCLRL